MKKLTVKFVFLLGIISLMGSQSLQAYKLYCPSPEFIELNDVNNKLEYSAPMKIDDDGSNKVIMMRAIVKEKVDTASFVLNAASVSRDNQLSCLYVPTKDSGTNQTLTLLAPLPKGMACTVTYPKGHEKPTEVYFECTDSQVRD